MWVYTHQTTQQNHIFRRTEKSKKRFLEANRHRSKSRCIVWRSSALLLYTWSSTGLTSWLFFISEHLPLCCNFQLKLKVKTKKNSWGMKRYCGPVSVFWGGRRGGREGQIVHKQRRSLHLVIAICCTSCTHPEGPLC